MERGDHGVSELAIGREALPFGNDGAELALSAQYLLEYLSAEPNSERDNEQLLADLLHFEIVAQDLGWVSIEEPGHIGEFRLSELRRLQSLVHRFHVSLPFTEAERFWLVQSYKVASDENSSHEAFVALDHKHEQIIVSGERRTVSGRELLERWDSWCRQEGNFSNQGTLEIATDALKELTQVANPAAH
jgi:hypothetical protein